MPTLEEYIARYEKKTGETFTPKAGFKLFYLPDRGFCEIAVAGHIEMVQAYQMCGDGRFWRDYITLLAQSLNIKMAGTFCIRTNVKAYARFFGYKITKKEPLPDGSFIYLAEDERGSHARLSPVHMHDDPNKITYLVTWEV